MSLRRPVAVAMLTLAACTESFPREVTLAPPPVATTPAGWHVADGAIRDPSGRTAILRGVNLSNAHKQKPYLSEFGPADYVALRQTYGFNVLRFLVTWAAIEPQKGVYDEVYLDEVAKRMRWANDAGLLVVVDMHQDLYGEGFKGGDGAPRWTCDESRYAAFVPTEPWFFGSQDPNVKACVDRFFEPGEVRTHFVAAWKRLARRLRDEPAVIGFDPLNEPYWGTFSILAFEEEKLAPFYVEVAKAVREEAPGWLAFVEPSASRNVGYPTRLPKLPVDGVVYAPHAYDVDAESGKGFDGARREALLARLRELRQEADAMGAALFIGEYGGNADAPGIVPYMDAQFDGIGAVAASSTYWAFDKDNGYGFLRADGSEKKVLADVVARPYPSRIAGKLFAYEVDDANGNATIRFRAETSITEPTEIVVPPRAIPDVAVDCAGCEVAIAPGVVRITKAPAGDVTAVIRKR